VSYSVKLEDAIWRLGAAIHVSSFIKPPYMVDGYCEVIPRPEAAVSSISGIQHQFSGEDV